MIGDGLAAVRECSLSEVDLPPLFRCCHRNKVIQRKEIVLASNHGRRREKTPYAVRHRPSEHGASRPLTRPTRSRIFHALRTSVSARVPWRCFHRHGDPAWSLKGRPNSCDESQGQSRPLRSQTGHAAGTRNDVWVRDPHIVVLHTRRIVKHLDSDSAPQTLVSRDPQLPSNPSPEGGEARRSARRSGHSALGPSAGIG